MTQKEFIELIKKKRLAQMIPQKDLAKKIPISKTAYSKIENHLQNPSVFVIQRLAEIFDIDLNILKNPPRDFIDYD
ncbi:MAG: helix-turn-helix domain-containing protein [Anaeroplasmataceae bacterium]|nr:helix-turn-helix domain-containing protein [Anaeroplasmataceae bacterium]MDE6414222.1 helix-turn-helix domain-containing protein [Anaeroplasmataceae bacterium]